MQDVGLRRVRTLCAEIGISTWGKRRDGQDEDITDSQWVVETSKSMPRHVVPRQEVAESGRERAALFDCRASLPASRRLLLGNNKTEREKESTHLMTASENRPGPVHSMTFNA